MVVVGTASEEREEREERVFNLFRIGGPKSLLLAVASLGGVASLLDLTNVEALAPYIVKSETGWAEELPATAIPPAQMMQEVWPPFPPSLSLLACCVCVWFERR